MNDTAYERVIRALRAAGSKVTDRNGKARATCPAHDDHSPSLSVTDVPGKGRVMLWCHTCCDNKRVVAALGLTMADLYDERRADYKYDDGRIVKRRYVNGRKTFPQNIPDPGSCVLYHLAELQAAPQGGVFLVEGEADVEAIEWAGGVATTAPQGADSFHKVDVSPLAGRYVTAVVDRDGGGEKWSVQVAAKLDGVVAGLRFVHAKEGKDASDHLAAGHDLTEFVVIEQEAAEPTHLDRLRAQLLDDAGLDAIPDPVPLIDGLIFRDTLVWLQGRPGHGKSFVALDWAASISTGESWQGYRVTQGPVLYLIAEGGSGFKKRVKAWKHAAGVDDTGIRYLPVAVQSSNARAWGAFCELAAELQPVLVVIDTQARVTVGMEENTSRDMSTFVERCEELRAATGATVMLIHHQGRTGEHLRGHSSMEGAATTIVRVEKTDETIKLACVKQKDEADFDDIALRLVPTDSSAVLALTADADGPQWNTPAVKRMLSEWWRLHESDFVSVSVLVKSGAVAEATFHRVKKALVKAGVVTTEGKGRAVRYQLGKNPDE